MYDDKKLGFDGSQTAYNVAPRFGISFSVHVNLFFHHSSLRGILFTYAI